MNKPIISAEYLLSVFEKPVRIMGVRLRSTDEFHCFSARLGKPETVEEYQAAVTKLLIHSRKDVKLSIFGEQGDIEVLHTNPVGRPAGSKTAEELLPPPGLRKKIRGFRLTAAEWRFIILEAAKMGEDATPTDYVRKIITEKRQIATGNTESGAYQVRRAEGWEL